MHFPPSPVALGVGSNLRDGVIHDAHRVPYDRRVLAGGMRSLVDAGEGHEGVPHSPRSQAPRTFFSHLPVDREPTAHIASKMSRCRARHERRTLSDTLATFESP